MLLFTSMRLAYVGLLALLIFGGCNRGDKSTPPLDAWATIQSEAFGAGTLTVEDNSVRVAVSDAGEGGVWFRASDTATAGAVVSFEYRGAVPANVRVTKANNELVYGSTDSRTYFVIEKGSTDGALVYSSAGSEFAITITGIEQCDAQGVVCRDDGVVERRIYGEELDADILARAHGRTALGSTASGSINAKSSGTGEFGITLRPAKSLSSHAILSFTNTGADRSLVVSGPERKEYFSAAQGWAILGKDEAALVYGAGPGSIELSNLQLKQCEPDDWKCALDSDLVKQSLAGSDGPHDLPTLLGWATREADFGFSQVVSSRVNISNLSAAQIYSRYYKDDAAGGFCGATAAFFARFLRAHGYEAFTLDFGLPATNLTHVTTIVADEGKFYILDATFGAYFVKWGTKEPLDILSVLDGVPYSLLELKAPDRTFIVDERTYKNPGSDTRLAMFRNCAKNTETGFLVCRNPDFGLTQYLQTFSEALSAAKLEAGEETLVEMLKSGVSGIGDGPDTDSMRTFARELDRRGIVFTDHPGLSSPSRLLLP